MHQEAVRASWQWHHFVLSLDNNKQKKRKKKKKIQNSFRSVALSRRSNLSPSIVTKDRDEIVHGGNTTRKRERERGGKEGDRDRNRDREIKRNRKWERERKHDLRSWSMRRDFGIVHVKSREERTHHPGTLRSWKIDRYISNRNPSERFRLKLARISFFA